MWMPTTARPCSRVRLTVNGVTDFNVVNRTLGNALDLRGTAGADQTTGLAGHDIIHAGGWITATFVQSRKRVVVA